MRLRYIVILYAVLSVSNVVAIQSIVQGCQRVRAWYNQLWDLTPAQHQVFANGCATFAADMTVRTLFVFIPSHGLQDPSWSRFYLTSVGTLIGRLAATRHLSDFEAHHTVTTITDRSITYISCGVIGALIARGASDLLLWLNPTTNILHTTFLVLSITFGPMISIRASYHGARQIRRIINSVFRRERRPSVPDVTMPGDTIISMDGTGPRQGDFTALDIQ